MITRYFRYECFWETLMFAESLGWVDPELDDEEDWSPSMADATEEDALDFIEEQGYKVVCI